MKAAAGALRGETGIFRKLREEHERITQLLEKIDDTLENSQGIERRCEMFPILRAELLAHAYAEEQEFYSVLRRHDVLRPIIDSSEEDHREMEMLLQELNPTELGGNTWRPEFERLRETVRRHVDQEEHDVFPKARAVLRLIDAREIEERYLKMKQRGIARLEASGGMTPQPFASP